MSRLYTGLAQLAYLLQWLITFVAIIAIIYVITAGIPYMNDPGPIAKVVDALARERQVVLVPETNI